MDSISESMRVLLRATPGSESPAHAPTAADIMPETLIAFRPEQRVHEAIAILIDRRISGGPVIDDEGGLVGILSESDCLRVATAGSYDGEDRGGQLLVGDLMTRQVETVGPDLDIYSIAQIFVDQRRRRLPVVADGRVLGQVSRRDVLQAIRARF